MLPIVMSDRDSDEGGVLNGATYIAAAEGVRHCAQPVVAATERSGARLREDDRREIGGGGS